MILSYSLEEGQSLALVLRCVLGELGMERSPSGASLRFPLSMKYLEDELRSLHPNPRTQGVYGVPGCDELVSKVRIWKSLVEAYGRQEASLVMPETWLLPDSNFSRVFDASRRYVLKKNRQRKEGLTQSSSLLEIEKSLDRGYRLVQNFEEDALAIGGHKVSLRAYLLVLSERGSLRFYQHGLGKCLYAAEAYTGKTSDSKEWAAGSSSAIELYRSRPQTFDDLGVYLGLSSIEISRRIGELLSRVSKALGPKMLPLENLRGTRCFQLFGCDFLWLNGNLKLLECNKGPDMHPKNERDLEVKYRVTRDMIELGLGLPSEAFSRATQNGFVQI